MALGDRLKYARNEAGYTLEGAAEAIGASFNTIWRYEAGYHKPSGPTLYALARLYRRPVEWFHGEGETSEVKLDEDDATYMEDLDLLMNEASLALRATAHDLSDEAIRSIADFIRYVHAREEREKSEREGTG